MVEKTSWLKNFIGNVFQCCSRNTQVDVSFLQNASQQLVRVHSIRICRCCNLNANFQCGQGPADCLKAASIHKNKSCLQDTQYCQSVAYINLYSAPLCLMDRWILAVSICTWCVSNATKRGFPFSLVD